MNTFFEQHIFGIQIYLFLFILLTFWFLEKISIEQNEYHIYSKDVKITATEGDFKDIAGDCIHENFPDVTIEMNNQKVVLKNISVQDYPAY